MLQVEQHDELTVTRVEPCEKPDDAENGVRYIRTMKPQIDDISAFVHVVDAGSMSAAARRMHLSKSVISSRIRTLETTLAVTLLRRTTRCVVPTDAGSAFYERACEILALLDDATMEATCAGGTGGRLQGLLRISAPLSFGSRHLGPLLMPFLRDNPRLECQIDLADHRVDLVKDRYDVAVRIGRLPDSGLVARRLGISQRVVCCSPAYAAEHGLPEGVDALRGHATIGYSHAARSHTWLFDNPDPALSEQPLSITIRPRITVNNGDMILHAAQSGLGIALLPHFIVAEALAGGTLINAMPAISPCADAIQVVFPPDRHLPLRTRQLIDYLVHAFEGRTW